MSEYPRTTTIYMTEESYTQLTKLCDETGLSQSAVVRTLIKREAEQIGLDEEEVRAHVSALARLLLYQDPRTKKEKHVDRSSGTGDDQDTSEHGS